MNEATALPAAPLHIVILDDEIDVRRAITRALSQAGYEVTAAGSAEEALSALAGSTARVLITDLIMPRVSGTDLIRQVRQEFPAVAIVAISGGGNYWHQGYKPEAITTSAYLAAANVAGADVVLAKPFELVELLDAVRRAAAPRH